MSLQDRQLSVHLPLLADRMQHNSSPMRTAAMLKEIDTLPSSERGPPVDHRYGQVRLCKNRTDMRGHVIRPFRSVSIEAVVLGNQPGEESLEIMQDVGVSILLNRQRR